MSRAISLALKNHFGGDVRTIAPCWKLVRQDSTVMGFTGHDKDIEYDSVTYAAATGFLPTAVSQNAALSVDNLEAMSFLDSEAITETDVEAGLYDGAEIDIFLINYADTTMGVVYLVKGFKLGEVKVADHTASAEIRGLAAKLQQEMLELVSPDCRATLGDYRCGVDVEGLYTVAGTVTTATDRSTLIDTGRTETEDVFAYGLLTFTSGVCDGFSMEVKSYDPATDTIVLFLPMPYQFEVGDTYSLTYGCDGSPDTCKNTFDNFVNFQGEPAVPGINQMMQAGG